MFHNYAYGLPMAQLDVAAIDDSRSSLKIIKTVLKELRVHRIRTYHDAGEALWELSKDPPHLIVCDWNMRPMEGYEVVRAARRHDYKILNRVPIIVVTGLATQAFVEDALRSGATQILVKPLSPKSLRQRIEWIQRDKRRITAQGEQAVIEGVDEMLREIARARASRERPRVSRTEWPALPGKAVPRRAPGQAPTEVPMRAAAGGASQAVAQALTQAATGAATGAAAAPAAEPDMLWEL